MRTDTVTNKSVSHDAWPELPYSHCHYTISWINLKFWSLGLTLTLRVIIKKNH